MKNLRWAGKMVEEDNRDDLDDTHRKDSPRFAVSV